MNTDEDIIDERVHGRVVFPGETIINLSEIPSSRNITIGPGLMKRRDKVISIKAGILRLKAPSKYWIETHVQRYVPVKGDDVLGIVASKAGEYYKVDIGCNEQAVIYHLSFEGATKRNRANIKVGDLLYARLSAANKDMEPELVCIDGLGKAKGLGVLSDGFVISVSVSYAKRLLHVDSNVIKIIGSSFPFEVTVGLNGKIWVKGKSLQNTIAISNFLAASEFMNEEQLRRAFNNIRNVFTKV